MARERIVIGLKLWRSRDGQTVTFHDGDLPRGHYRTTYPPASTKVARRAQCERGVS